MKKLSRKEWGAIHDKAWAGYLDKAIGGPNKLQVFCLDKIKDIYKKEDLCVTQEITNGEHIIKIGFFSNPSFGVIRVSSFDAELENSENFFHVEECGCLAPDEFCLEIIEILKTSR